MSYSQNLSLRTLAQPIFGISRKLKRCADFLLSIPTTCPHANRCNLSSFQQACWDCKRVHYNGGRGWSVWHRDGVR